jgi:FixJ family two-component response regulator
MPHHASVVAVVDDDRRLLESLEELLESAGHRVRLFSSGQDFLDEADLAALDCLITDIGMPGMDGFALQRIVAARRPELPVILVTGRHELAELPQARQRPLFRKPFDGPTLLAAVDAAVTRKEDT